MKLFRYYGYMNNECIVGIVKANTLQEAKAILKNTYDDYDMWLNKTVEKAVFDNDVWEKYCSICKVSPAATSLKIIFDECEDVEAEYDDYEDEDEDEYEEEYDEEYDD